VVIACGPLSGLVAEAAGVRLPIQPLRRQRVAIWNLAGIPPRAPMTIDEETTAHWRPVGDRGAYLLYPDPAEQPAPPATRVDGDPEFAFALLDPTSPRWIGRTAPFWAEVWERNSAVWSVQAGQYTMTADQLPLLGETEVGGLFVNTGYSGHGVMAGPGGSEHLVEVIMGERTDNPFRIDREFTTSSQAF
jgi:sarcosine oxidase subunit beta